MIINIVGAQGSGKTYLGYELAKLPNVKITEIDDVARDVYMKLLKEYKNLTDKNIDQFYREAEDLIHMAMNTNLTNDKINIIITVIPCIEYINVDYGFCIKIDADANLQQLNNRMFERIIKYKSQIRKLLQTNSNPLELEIILPYKYNIVIPFPEPVNLIEERLGNVYFLSKRAKYKILPQKEILNKIKQLIT